MLHLQHILLLPNTAVLRLLLLRLHEACNAGESLLLFLLDLQSRLIGSLRASMHQVRLLLLLLLLVLLHVC